MYDIGGKSFFDLATDPEFWLHLNPHLTISRGSKPQARPFALETESAFFLENLKEEGYFKIENNVMDAGTLPPLVQAVKKIRDEHWPTPFLFVYDQCWQQFQHLNGLLSQILGNDYKMMPALWTFCVEPGGGSAGFMPHRDRSRRKTVAADGRTTAMNIWISLTECSPDTGCIHLLPLQYDPNFPDNLCKYGVVNYQDIRAVPTKAGDILAWNEAVYHWGGRSSKHGTYSRISIAASFQRADCKSFETPLLKPMAMPSGKQKLSLIASQLLRYQAQAGLSPVLKELAVQLAALDEPLVVNDEGGPFIYDAPGEKLLNSKALKK